ncbi:hypothetical protein GGR53DRAFT_470018 [Hypoxylon sp. FL1150]|nr:hypothetical protein GGR53DRAFT_470018 [Hypoxylon sp. FL1150]
MANHYLMDSDETAIKNTKFPIESLNSPALRAASMISIKIWTALAALLMCLAVAQPLPADLVAREKAALGNLPTPERVNIIAAPHTNTFVGTEDVEEDA